MNLLFTPNHIQLLNACYPPTSALLTAGPDYSPNSQELSRLTYYASNHPGKLAKVGSELEKRLKVECRKAKAGNLRTRASLLITLAVFRALATECRRDIALLSPSLVASVDAALSATPADLEVAARAASVFTAWTTYTNGHLIGADSSFTRNYLSVLGAFAQLSCTQTKDQEVQNRTRLIGFAALTGALTSEALYNDTVQFRAQVAIIMRPILVTMFQADIKVLDAQANTVKDTPLSPYLSEFRTRPTIERRAASIHLHIDGDKGPSVSDVSSACLRAYFALLEHSNGSQLGYIVRSSFDNLDQLKGWANLPHCCWFAQKSADWAQYQYRYAVPTWIVERLLEAEDASVATAVQHALTNMVTNVFKSATPLVNLSTSDILSNLMTVLIRRTAIDSEDSLLPGLVQCIASLGTHVYYSDQIQDLAVETINRLTIVEVQGVIVRGTIASTQVRMKAIRVLLASLLGLIHSADAHDVVSDDKRSVAQSQKSSVDAADKDAGVDERASRRTKVSPDIWHDTLSLLCDREFAVRTDYAHALSFYIANEMPKHPEGHQKMLTQQTVNKNALLYSGDVGTKFLSALHAYIYILSTTSSLGLSLASSPSASLSASTNGDALESTHKAPDIQVDLAEKEASGTAGNGERPSLANIQAPRGRKVSLAFKLLEGASQDPTTSSATLSDFADILDILSTVHAQLPVRGLLTGLPMLLALDASTRHEGERDGSTVRRHNAIKVVLAKVWLLLGSQWELPEIVNLAEEALRTTPDGAKLPSVPALEIGIHNPQEALDFASTPLVDDEASWMGVDADAVLTLLISSENVQEATGLDATGLRKRLSQRWAAPEALQDSYKRSKAYDNTIRGDGVSPLLKISPALMHIENMSLQSLPRSTRAVGVTDLREALEGRSSMSMSNPALAIRPSSISTLDHGSSLAGGDSRLTQTRSRTAKKRTISGRPGEVRDVLNRLGIGKQNDSLLKASFPALQAREQH